MHENQDSANNDRYNSDRACGWGQACLTFSGWHGIILSHAPFGLLHHDVPELLPLWPANDNYKVGRNKVDSNTKSQTHRRARYCHNHHLFVDSISSIHVPYRFSPEFGTKASTWSCSFGTNIHYCRFHADICNIIITSRGKKWDTRAVHYQSVSKTLGAPPCPYFAQCPTFAHWWISHEGITVDRNTLSPCPIRLLTTTWFSLLKRCRSYSIAECYGEIFWEGKLDTFSKERS